MKTEVDAVSTQKNVGLEMVHKLNQAQASHADWEETPSYRLAGFSINQGPAAGDWVIFGEATKDDIVPPRARLVVSQDKGEKWFNPKNRSVTVERLDDGQRLISDPDLLTAMGGEAVAVINAVGAAASFNLNRGYKIGKSLSHVKTRRLGEDETPNFTGKIVEARAQDNGQQNGRG
ncbi:MAG: hypothetical protein FJX23_10185 [Alphaproteobacteria bacterium]|nr:hypothetical protein [Alphaproteobacteria bacterium]